MNACCRDWERRYLAADREAEGYRETLDRIAELVDRQPGETISEAVARVVGGQSEPSVTCTIDELARVLRFADEMAQRISEVYGFCRQFWQHEECPAALIHGDTTASEYEDAVDGLRFRHPEVRP